MPYTPKGADENADQGPDSFGHSQAESPRPAKAPMPVDVLPVPARDMPDKGFEGIGGDDDILEEARRRADRK